MADEKCSAVKAYLQKIKLYDTHINNKIAEKAILMDMATNITSTWKEVVVAGSGSQDKIGDTVGKLRDLEIEIDRMIDEFVDQKNAVCTFLEELQNPDHVAILHKRYVQYLTFEQIACDMHICYRHATRMHGRALQAIEKVLIEKGVL